MAMALLVEIFNTAIFENNHDVALALIDEGLMNFDVIDQKDK